MTVEDQCCIFLYSSVKRKCYSSSFFFFSSRRRHTRYIGDWSSDVCSSDLVDDLEAAIRGEVIDIFPAGAEMPVRLGHDRSEERRVGKECRSRWGTGY